jgi:hypothetical protein
MNNTTQLTEAELRSMSMQCVHNVWRENDERAEYISPTKFFNVPILIFHAGEGPQSGRFTIFCRRRCGGRAYWFEPNKLIQKQLTGSDDRWDRECRMPLPRWAQIIKINEKPWRKMVFADVVGAGYIGLESNKLQPITENLCKQNTQLKLNL